jgi:hypothetical protein
MESDRIVTRAASGPILDDIAPLAGGKDSESKARQFVVPGDVVLLADFGSVDDPLGDFRHVLLPSRAGLFA